MSCIKKLFLSLSLVLIIPIAHSSIIDLGVADKYTLAVGQYNYYGTPVGGNLVLGSDAWIHGKVAASNSIGFGAGSIIYDNSCAPNITDAKEVKGQAITCNDVNKQSDTGFDQLSIDIAAANQQGALLNSINMGLIDQTTTIDASNYNALAFSSINLSSGEFLTVNGSTSDNIVLNITGNALIGSGAGILLTGGLTSKNVFFNFVTNGQALFNFGGANISGTFIANNGAFIAGDGAQLNDVRFYTNNTLIANVQEVYTAPYDYVQSPNSPSFVSVPEPKTLYVLLLGLIILRLSTLKNFFNNRFIKLS